VPHPTTMWRRACILPTVQVSAQPDHARKRCGAASSAFDATEYAFGCDPDQTLKMMNVETLCLSAEELARLRDLKVRGGNDLFCFVFGCPGHVWQWRQSQTSKIDLHGTHGLRCDQMSM
jgi:hypothetical protein